MSKWMTKLIAGIALTFGITLNVQADTSSYIVQLNQAPAAHMIAQQRQAGGEATVDEIQAYRSQLAQSQDQFLAALQANGITFAVEATPVSDLDANVSALRLRFTLVLNGMALTLNEDQVASVEAMPQVKAVSRNWMKFPQLVESVDYINAPEVYGSIEELTRFDDLNEGFEGQGMYISVIDTGIDWGHPMFGDDPTPPRFGLAPPANAVPTHEKIVYYLPFTDTIIATHGHGTHVSSTAAGYLAFAPGPDGVPLTDDDVGIHGVAPQARLMEYQVCSNLGSTAGVFGCPTAVIILALEDSVSRRTLTGFTKPVADVINLSLGGAGGPNDPTSVAANNAALAGAVVVAAAGNSGPGERTLGSPAAGVHVIAVAASNDPGEAPNSINVLTADGSDVMPGSPTIVAAMAPDSNAGMPLEAPISAHYVFAGKADTPDQVPLTVAGNICLVIRGSTVPIAAADAGTGLFASKAANCEAKGAIATVIYNNVPGRIGPALAPTTRPVFTISQAHGQLLQSLGYNATGVSNFPIRLNLPNAALYDPGITGFSSRGPVQGLGQVKPDLAAPGLNVLAAATRTGTPILGVGSPTGYTAISGTSMATPHAVGAATLVQQAHLGWGPAEVRTAMMNTATNPRLPNGIPQFDGDIPIIAQGAGLIDVEQAVNIKALMGVTGDGIITPSILGSHSFGAIPAVNSRVTHTETATVTLRDISGEGGIYNVSVTNNHGLELNGVAASVSPTSVTVPSNGSATFTTTVLINGDELRETDGSLVQWFVTATRADGGETLRMPLYTLLTGTVPAGSNSSETHTFTGTILVGDQNQGLVEGVTYMDFPLEATTATLRFSANLDFEERVANTIPDLDMFVFGPDGTEVARSASPGGPEALSFRVTEAGTYTFRVNGWLNAPTDFTLTLIEDTGGEPPVLSDIKGEYVNSEGEGIDFDGNYQVTWQPVDGNVQKYEIERSVNGASFEVIAQVDAGTTSYQVSGQSNGDYAYRVRALYPGQIGFFVSAPSNVERVVVDQRTQVDITDETSSSISNVSFQDGTFEFDLQLTNEASSVYVPLVEFTIVNIDSASGTVELINADNGGSGRSPQDPALFGYSRQLGDERFAPQETTEPRHLKFSDEQAELFSFDAVVTAYLQSGAGNAGSGDSGSTPPDGGEGGENSITQLLRYTVNPLTGTVTVNVIEGLL